MTVILEQGAEFEMLNLSYRKSENLDWLQRGGAQFQVSMFSLTRRIFERLEANAIERQKRAEIRKLLHVGDDQLKDLGIPRDEIRHILKQSLRVNSGRELERLRRKQRKVC